MEIVEKSWQGKSDELLKKLDSSKDGLTGLEVQKRILHFGLNTIRRQTPIPFLQILFDQFIDLLVVLLIVAATLSFLLGETKNGIVISLIVFLNAAIGFFQEFKAEKILKALNKLLPMEVKVKRDGQEQKINTSFLVPGDIVIIDEGDTIPADIRILESYELKTNEQVLTGESQFEEKRADDFLIDPPLHELKNMLFMGTVATSGEAVGVVVGTGYNTEFGKIASKTISINKTLSPLQEKTKNIAKKITFLVVGMMILLLIYYYFTRHDIVSALVFSVAIAAALVPEGLPAIISVALSVGAREMAKRKALVRNLVSVETLGSTTVICTDKTGTLTTGEMTVKEIWPSHNNGFEKEKNQELINEVLVLCNDAEIGEKNEVGDPLEVALLLWAKKQNIDIKKLREKYSKIDEIPFSATRRYMKTIYKGENENHEFLKGAPEVILEKCDLAVAEKNKILEKYESFAREGYRVLALAKDKIFLGLVAIYDPPRAEVLQAIKECELGGIRTIMITGDGALTAASIAKIIGISNEENPKVLLGTDLEKMSDLELRNSLNDVNVFARVLPEQKYKIVDTLMRMGEVVAATGDGVNDAPALKRADIGLAMGKNGTDVSREAADMVLIDDNFATIVRAVELGRVMFDNIKKVFYFVFTHNFGELLIVLISIILGLPLAMIPVQILAVDLGTDVLPSMALIAEQGENVMQSSPRSKKVQLVTAGELFHLFLLGLVIGIGAIINFTAVLNVDNYQAATTIAFSTLVICQLFNIFLSRCPNTSIFKYPFWTNKWLLLAALSTLLLLLLMIYTNFFNTFLSTAPFPMIFWPRVILVGIAFLVFEEIYKWIGRYRYVQK